MPNPNHDDHGRFSSGGNGGPSAAHGIQQSHLDNQAKNVTAPLKAAAVDPRNVATPAQREAKAHLDQKSAEFDKAHQNYVNAPHGPAKNAAAREVNARQGDYLDAKAAYKRTLGL